MKKLLVFLTVSLSVTFAHGQLNPVKNLHGTRSYQYLNDDCPSYNCFQISWLPPDFSLADTLLGYNMYQNGTFYSFFDKTITGFGCPGWPVSGCSFTTPNWVAFLPPYDAHPFYVTVKAVYNKDSVLSIATDSIYFGGVIIGIKELKSKEYISISPNPFSVLTVVKTDNPLINATLTIDNCFGQTVKQIKNISGQSIILYRENLPDGLYFLYLTQENKTFTAEKLVIADN
jgi:hypothetical protein